MGKNKELKKDLLPSEETGLTRDAEAEVEAHAEAEMSADPKEKSNFEKVIDESIKWVISNKKWAICAVAAFLVIIMLIINVIPGKEDVILKYIEDEQYEEALEYVNRKKFSGIDGDGGKSAEVELRLLYKYMHLCKEILSGEATYEEGKAAYELGIVLSRESIEKSVEGKELKKVLGMIEESAEVKSLLEAKRYTEAFVKFTTSEYSKDGVYLKMIGEAFEGTDKEALAEKLKIEIEELTKEDGFTEIPEFIENKTDLIGKYISDEESEELISTITAANRAKMCWHSGCENIKVKGFEYCVKHKCKTEDCGIYVIKGYCKTHRCNAWQCTKPKVENSYWCDTHTCAEEDCVQYTESEYCGRHKKSA